MKYNFDKVINRKDTDCYKWDTTKDGVIPMWVADMDFEVAKPIVDSIIKRAKHPVFGYTMVPNEYFEAEISWWKKRFNYEIKKEHIIPTVGVIPSLSAIIQTFCQKDDKILIQSPVYHYFNIVIQNNDCKVITNNLIYKDVKYDVLVISDEIHRDLVFKDYIFTPFASICEEFLQNSITCTSATKTFNLAGLKASNIVAANKDLRVKLDKTLSKNEMKGVNIFGIYSLISAYKECEDWLFELLIYLEKNKNFLEDFIAKNIPNLKVVKAEATYLLWIDISSLNMDSKEFTKKLEELGKVRVISGVTFGENGDNFIRVNIATPLEILKEAVFSIKKTVESF